MSLASYNEMYREGNYLNALYGYRLYSKRHPVTASLIGLENNIDFCLSKLKIKSLNRPYVSVIIPAHNVEQYIERCLESVINQTLHNIEIIIVNDGSTDKTLSIIEQYNRKDNRIKVISNTKASGNSGYPRNQALCYATGMYICFVDADDYIEKDMLEDMYHKSIYTAADICTSTGFFKETDGVEELITLSDVSTEGGASKRDLLSLSQFPIVWYRIYNLDFILENNIFFGGFKVSADLIFSFKALMLAEKIVKIDKQYYHYNFGRPGSTIERRRGSEVLDIFKSYEATMDFIMEKNMEIYADIVLRKFIGDYFYCIKNMHAHIRQDFDSFSSVFVKRYLRLMSDRSVISDYSNKKLDEIYGEYSDRNSNIYDAFLESTGIESKDITVIIPSHNVEDYIGKCLESVTTQTLKNIEIIIINDGSTDRTKEIINRYASNDSRIQVVNISHASGYPGIGRNIGLILAKGKYISFVDSDDWIDKECLYRFYSETNNGASDIIYSRAFFREEGMISKKFNIGMEYTGKINKENRDKIINTNFLSNVWHKIYRRDFLNKNYILFPRMYVSEDLSFSLICAFLASYVSVAETQGYHYRYNRRDSTTQQRMGVKSLKQIFEYEEFLRFFKRDGLTKDLYQIALKKKLNSFLYTYDRLDDINLKEYFRFEVSEILRCADSGKSNLDTKELIRYKDFL